MLKIWHTVRVGKLLGTETFVAEVIRHWQGVKCRTHGEVILWIKQYSSENEARRVAETEAAYLNLKQEMA